MNVLLRSTDIRMPHARLIAWSIVLGIGLAALLATRPWSSRNSFRQMRMFAEGDRIHNFQSMDEIFPDRVVRHAAPARRFAVQARSLPNAFEYGGHPVALDEFFDRTVTTGLLVLQGDTIVAERYFRGARADTPLTSWSVAKSVVSLLIGIAKAEHRIAAVTDPLARYAPELRGTAYGRVSLRDALTMSSGIAFSERYGDWASDIHTLFSRLFYFRESAAHYLAHRAAEAAPGARFQYASSDTLALALALRHAVGVPLATYLQQKLWQPLGMEYDASWSMEESGGLELGFCCLNVRLRDYAKLGRLVARGGDWDGRRIVPAEWIEESTRIEPARAPGKLAMLPWGYQYQWWLPGRDAVMAAGIWGQYIYVDRAHGTVIVKTSVDPDFMQHDVETVSAFQAIVDAL
jgi:CubicO group peptidase (beta-lactamase class C family)